MTGRMFVAAIPPADVVADLDEFLDVRREAGGFRWTLPEQWHLTLAFLPEVPPRSLDVLLEGLSQAAARTEPMTARLVGGGAFPHVAEARVLWAGVEVDRPTDLDALARHCRTAAVRAGVATPRERFRPHLTLARTGRGFEATRWIRVLDSYRGHAYSLDEIALVASHLGEGPRRRPRYEIVADFRLGAASKRTDPPN